MTLNELIYIIETFGVDSRQIWKTYFGVRETVDTEQSNGMVQWFHVEPTSVIGNSLNATFKVSFMDVLNNDQSNELDILSDTQDVAEGFLAYMYNEEEYANFNISERANISWFGGGDDSDYFGHTVDISIEIPFEYNYCEIPFSGAADSTGSESRRDSIKYLSFIVDEFAENYISVNHSQFGRKIDIDSSDMDGQIIWWYVNDGQVENSLSSYNYSAIFLDILNNDSSNEGDVYSDTFKSAKDFLGYLHFIGHTSGFELDREEVSITPTKNLPTSDYAGYRVDFTINTQMDFTLSNVPMYQCLANEDGLFITGYDAKRIQV